MIFSIFVYLVRGLHVSASLNKTKPGASGKGSLFPAEPAIVAYSQYKPAKVGYFLSRKKGKGGYSH